MNQVLNLDALRAPSRKVLFLGREWEVGYVPSGASIPLVEGYNKMLDLQAKAMGEVTAEAEAAYRVSHSKEIEDMNIDYVTSFCQFWDPSITRKMVSEEATVEMVDGFFVEIIGAVMTNASRGSKESPGSKGAGKKN